MAPRCLHVAVLVALAASLACFGSFSLAGRGVSFTLKAQQLANSPPQTPAAVPRVPTILVFPYENGSRNPNLDWLCEGLAELTIERLQGPRRFILAREDRLEASERMGLPASANVSRATMITLGEDADADVIVFGRFTSDGKTISMTARALQLAPPSLSPSFSATSALPDLLNAQLQLSGSLLCAILPEACPSGAPPPDFFVPGRPPSRLDAVRQFVRGLEDSNEDDRIADLRDAARLEADWDAPAFALGVAFYRRHDCESVLVWLSRVPPGRPHGAEAGFDAGVCHLQGHDPARAESAFEAVLQQPRPGSETPPDSPEARNNLGVAQAELGKLTDAISQFEKAAQVEASTANFWFNLGVAQFLAGRATESLASLQRAAQLTPQDSGIRSVADEIQTASAGGAGSPPHQASFVARMRISERFDRTWLRPSAEPASARDSSGSGRARFEVSQLERRMGEPR